MNAAQTKTLPIGVFESGVGGLTVLKALRDELPHEDLIYLGDTARLPYGTKSPASIARYACRATRHLQDQGIKLLVVACNTASAVALQALREIDQVFVRQRKSTQQQQRDKYANPEQHFLHNLYPIP